MRSLRLPRPLLALGVFTLLAVVHTWPLATDPAHLSRNDNGDALLTTWAVSWVAHILPRDPARLFHANIFYPERFTLAYSESLVVQGILATPVIAAGGSPVLAFSLVLMAGFALTGWAFCLLMWRWTGSWSAAYVAGSLAAFNSHVLVRLPHLQTQHVEFVALMLFALDRLVGGRRRRDAVLLGVGFALQGLTSVYLLVFSTWTMIFAVLARLRDWCRRDRWLMMIRRFGLAAAVALLLLAPYLFGYYSLHRLTGFERRAGDQFAASWVDYLATGSRIHFPLWSHRFFSRAYSPAFPGVVAAVLAGLALVWRETRGDARVRMAAGVALGCAAVSFLPWLPFYPALHAMIPLFKAVRVPAHLGQFELLMVAVLAGFAVAALERRWTRTGSWPVVALSLVVLVNAEALRAPLWWQPFSGVSPIHDRLARERHAVVVNLPFYSPRQFFLNAPYMLDSTRHWHPMLNGYSGFIPRSYGEMYEALVRFPDVPALAALHARGVTHVVVHDKAFVDAYGQARFDALGQFASLSLLDARDGIHLYRLE